MARSNLWSLVEENERRIRGALSLEAEKEEEPPPVTSTEVVRAITGLSRNGLWQALDDDTRKGVVAALRDGVPATVFEPEANFRSDPKDRRAVAAERWYNRLLDDKNRVHAEIEADDPGFKQFERKPYEERKEIVRSRLQPMFRLEVDKNDLLIPGRRGVAEEIDRGFGLTKYDIPLTGGLARDVETVASALGDPESTTYSSRARISDRLAREDDIERLGQEILDSEKRAMGQTRAARMLNITVNSTPYAAEFYMTMGAGTAARATGKLAKLEQARQAWRKSKTVGNAVRAVAASVGSSGEQATQAVTAWRASKGYGTAARAIAAQMRHAALSGARRTNTIFLPDVVASLDQARFGQAAPDAQGHIDWMPPEDAFAKDAAESWLHIWAGAASEETGPMLGPLLSFIPGTNRLTAYMARELETRLPAALLKAYKSGAGRLAQGAISGPVAETFEEEAGHALEQSLQKLGLDMGVPDNDWLLSGQEMVDMLGAFSLSINASRLMAGATSMGYTRLTGARDSIRGKSLDQQIDGLDALLVNGPAAYSDQHRKPMVDALNRARAGRQAGDYRQTRKAINEAYELYDEAFNAGIPGFVGKMSEAINGLPAPGTTGNETTDMALEKARANIALAGEMVKAGRMESAYDLAILASHQSAWVAAENARMNDMPNAVITDEATRARLAAGIETVLEGDGGIETTIEGEPFSPEGTQAGAPELEPAAEPAREETDEDARARVAAEAGQEAAVAKAGAEGEQGGAATRRITMTVNGVRQELEVPAALADELERRKVAARAPAPATPAAASAAIAGDGPMPGSPLTAGQVISKAIGEQPQDEEAADAISEQGAAEVPVQPAPVGRAQVEAGTPAPGLAPPAGAEGAGEGGEGEAAAGREAVVGDVGARPQWITDAGRDTASQLTDQQRSEITRLHAADKTAKEIAKATGLDEETVRLARVGLNLPDQGKPMTVNGVETEEDPAARDRFKAWAATVNAAPSTAEDAAPARENPYLSMPIERVRSDADAGVELAKQAVAQREGTEEGVTAVKPSGAVAATQAVNDDWSSFAPNDLGYQAREVPGLDQRYFVAQQSPDRFDVIESERGSTRATVTRDGGKWGLSVEGTTVQRGQGAFQSLFRSAEFDTPQDAIVAFNDALKAWEQPESVSLAEYVKWQGKPEGHRNAVQNAIAAGRAVAPEALADYPDLRPAGGSARPAAQKTGEGVEGEAQAPKDVGRTEVAWSSISTIPRSAGSIKTGWGRTIADLRASAAPEEKPLAVAAGAAVKQNRPMAVGYGGSRASVRPLGKMLLQTRGTTVDIVIPHRDSVDIVRVITGATHEFDAWQKQFASSQVPSGGKAPSPPAAPAQKPGEGEAQAPKAEGESAQPPLSKAEFDKQAEELGERAWQAGKTGIRPGINYGEGIGRYLNAARRMMYDASGRKLRAAYRGDGRSVTEVAYELYLADQQVPSPPAAPAQKPAEPAAPQIVERRDLNGNLHRLDQREIDAGRAMLHRYDAKGNRLPDGGIVRQNIVGLHAEGAGDDRIGRDIKDAIQTAADLVTVLEKAGYQLPARQPRETEGQREFALRLKQGWRPYHLNERGDVVPASREEGGRHVLTASRGYLWAKPPAAPSPVSAERERLRKGKAKAKAPSTIEQLRAQAAEVLVKTRNFHPADAALYAAELGGEKELAGFLANNTPEALAALDAAGQLQSQQTPPPPVQPRAEPTTTPASTEATGTTPAATAADTRPTTPTQPQAAGPAGEATSASPDQGATQGAAVPPAETGQTQAAPTSPTAQAQGEVVVEPPAAFERKAEALDRGTTAQLKVQKKYLIDRLSMLIAKAPAWAAELTVPPALVAESEAAAKAAKEAGAAVRQYMKENGIKKATGEDRKAHPRLVELMRAEDKASLRSRKALSAVALASAEHVTIEVPGDGTFRIKNDKPTLEAFRKVAKKDMPVAPPSVGGQAPKRLPAMPAIPDTPAKPETDEAKVRKIAEPFASDDPTREAISQVRFDPKTSTIFATDGLRLFMVGKPRGAKWKGWKTEGIAPNYRQIVPAQQSNSAEFDIGEALQKIDLATRIFTKEDSDTAVTVMMGTDGELAVQAELPDGDAYQSDNAAGAAILFEFNPQFIREGLDALKRLGADRVKMGWDNSFAPVKFTGIGTTGTYVLMPRRGDQKDDDAPTLAVSLPAAFAEEGKKAEAPPAEQPLAPTPHAAPAPPPAAEAPTTSEPPPAPSVSRTTPRNGTPERDAIETAQKETKAEYEKLAEQQRDLRAQRDAAKYGSARRDSLEKRLDRLDELVDASRDRLEKARKPWRQAWLEDEAESDNVFRRANALVKLERIPWQEGQAMVDAEVQRRGAQMGATPEEIAAMQQDSRSYTGLTRDDVMEILLARAKSGPLKAKAEDEVNALYLPADVKERHVAMVRSASIWPDDIQRQVDAAKREAEQYAQDKAKSDAAEAKKQKRIADERRAKADWLAGMDAAARERWRVTDGGELLGGTVVYVTRKHALETVAKADRPEQYEVVKDGNRWKIVPTAEALARWIDKVRTKETPQEARANNQAAEGAMSGSDRDRLRGKQDAIVAFAESRGLPEDVPFTTSVVAAPTVAELRSSLYPKYEGAIDRFIEEYELGKPGTGPTLTPAGEAEAPAPGEAEQGEGEEPDTTERQDPQADAVSADEAAETDADTGIQDFGEKIGGARKDTAPSVSRDISDGDMTGMAFSEIWPRAEVDAIEDPGMAALASALRSAVPAKPRKAYKVEQWVERVKLVRTLMAVANERGLDSIMQRMESGEYPQLGGLAAKVNLLRHLPRDQWDRIGKVDNYPNAVRWAEAKEGDAGAIKRWTRSGDKWYTTESEPYAVATVDGHLVRADSLDALHRAVAERLGTTTTSATLQFQVRAPRSGGSAYINKKGDPLYRKLKEFTGPDAVQQALTFIKENRPDLVSAWEAVKESDNVKETDVRRAVNRPRTAANYRQGRDATPQLFMETFGFRGVEFGNWVAQGENQKERQGMLNEAFDALLDLAAIVRVPPRALSLNGELALGFGSRGHGWASAHYEPDKIVINLTKTRGAGTLAHEWFHALDHYFQRQRPGEQRITKEGAEMMTFQPEGYYQHAPTGHRLSATRYRRILAQGGIKTPSEWTRIEGGVRPEVEEAFVDLVKALNESPMRQRSALIDKGRSGGYWSRIIERAARAFENYVIHQMAKNGYQNDYLANVARVEEFQRDVGRYPYLLDSELAPVAAAFDNLFGAVKTRTTDRGIAMYSPASPGTAGMPLAEAQRRIAPFQRRYSRAKVQVVNGTAGLPAKWRERVRADQDAGLIPSGQGWKGIYDTDTGTVYLNSAAARDAKDLIGTALHEVVGHLGLRAMFQTDSGFNGFLDSLYTNNKAVRERAKRLMAGQTGTAGDRRIATEEAVAGFARDLAEPTVWQRIVEALRKALRAVVGPAVSMKDMPDAEQIRLIVANAKRAAQGQGASGRAAAMAARETDATKGQLSGDAGYDDQSVRYSAADEYAPEKTVKAYKQFRTLATRPGELFPLFIGKTKPVPVGKWVVAEFIPTKGFAERPGWHAGVLPTAPHLRTKANRIADDRVWAEVEMPADRDWQPEADASPTRDIRNAVPANGFYRFKTSKMQGGAWMIGGALKVNRVLSDDDVAEILNQNGMEDDARAERHGDAARYSAAPAVTPAQDAAYLAAVEAGDTATAQRMVDEAAKAAGYNVGPVYHGTDSDFTEFRVGEKKFGLHFGTPEQASARSDNKGVRAPKTVRAHISLTNPLRMADLENWKPNQITEELFRKQKLGELSVERSEIERLDDDMSEAGYSAHVKGSMTDKQYDVIVDRLQQWGYDGVVYANAFEGRSLDDSYAVFSPSQIKSADPVTRDDSGRVIPLSERFNPQKTDIRYSAAEAAGAPAPRYSPLTINRTFVREADKLYRELPATQGRRKKWVEQMAARHGEVVRPYLDFLYSMLQFRRGRGAPIDTPAADKLIASIRDKAADLEAYEIKRQTAEQAALGGTRREQGLQTGWQRGRMAGMMRGYQKGMKEGRVAGAAEEREKGRLTATEYSIDKAITRAAKARGLRELDWLADSARHVQMLAQVVSKMPTREKAWAEIERVTRTLFGPNADNVIRSARHNMDDVMNYLLGEFHDRMRATYASRIQAMYDRFRPERNVASLAFKALGDTYREQMAGWLKRLRPHVKLGRTGKLFIDVKAIDPAELQDIYEQAQAIRAGDRLDKQALKQAKAETAENAAAELSGEVAAAHKEKLPQTAGTPQDRGFLREKFVDRFVGLREMALVAFGGEDTAGFRLFYEALRRGSTEAKAMAYRARRELDEFIIRTMLKGKGEAEIQSAIDNLAMGGATPLRVIFDKWGLSHKTISKDVHGTTHVWSKAELMMLAALMERPEARLKLMENGFFSRGMEGSSSLVIGENPEATAEIMESLVNENLSADERAIARKMVDIMTAFAPAMNRVTTALYGQSRATEPRYAPMTVDSQARPFMEADDEAPLADHGAWVRTLEGSSFNKFTVDHSKPLVIGNIFEVFDSHVERMSAFANLTLPIRTMITVLQANGGQARIALNEYMGKEFVRRLRDTVQHVAGLASKPRAHQIQRWLNLITSNVSKSILGLNPTSYISNRVGGSLQLAAWMERVDPKAAADFLANSMKPTAPGMAAGEVSAEDRAIVARLMQNGYLADRFSHDMASVFIPMMSERLNPQHEMRARLFLRWVQTKSLQHMKHAEMRNAIQAFRSLQKTGHSDTEAAEILERGYRATQNSSDRLDDSQFMLSLRESGLGGMFPFMSQVLAMRTLMVADIIKVQQAAPGSPERAEAMRHLAFSAAGNIVGGILLQQAIGVLVSWATKGPPDDEKEKRRLLANLGFRAVSDVADSMLPSARYFTDMAIGAAQGYRRGGDALIFERPIEQTVGGLTDIIRRASDPSLRVQPRNWYEVIVGATQVTGLPSGGPKKVADAMLNRTEALKPDRTKPSRRPPAAPKPPSPARLDRMRMGVKKAYRAWRTSPYSRRGEARAEFEAALDAYNAAARGAGQRRLTEAELAQ